MLRRRRSPTDCCASPQLRARTDPRGLSSLPPSLKVLPVRSSSKLAAWGRAQISGALRHAVRRACDRCPRGGSKLIFSSFSWHQSRRLRALIAVGFGILGALLVWAAFVRPYAPESAL